ncbi:MAG: hypothetical protein K2V38_19995, partial [Gemmataceae bacterium]|nr:hypothetical protein [Gemmataceae bacterium]
MNTIGTRPPGLNWNTVRRGFGKLQQWAGFRRSAAATDTSPSSLPAPRVLNPKMWPSFRSRFGRGLNRRLLSRALRPVVEAMPSPPVAVTTLPLMADLVGQFPATRWVYYCVDDFSVWPGLDGRTMRDMEAELVPKVDVAVAVSETLRSHLAELGKSAHLLTHGVD